ncbi:MAG: hypothetical protein IH631_03880, partial [Candidatus Thorarchaeota archaeon]|nr:hypothetical protein [Candidatus Thorarchaeota archaeon]
MSYIGPVKVVIVEGAIEELRIILADYRSPLIVTDEVIHAQYSSIVEEIIEVPCKWVMASVYSRNSHLSLG